MEKTQILAALQTVRYPGNGKNIVENNMLADLTVEGNRVAFSLVFPRKGDAFQRSLLKAAEQAIRTFVAEDANIAITTVFPEASNKETKENILPDVKNLIAVFSGKGGVGKSTVAANLAVALARAGFRTGLLDADIHGPSLPKMFGVEDEQIFVTEENGRQKMIPIEKYGVKMLSVGFFVDKNSALVWRGTIAGNALRQLITDAAWGELDFFVIDLPPGTGDIQLTLTQSIQMTGAIAVTTPQEIALADVRKGINMFQNEKIGLPVLGVVENMAWFTPAELPENRYYIFGKNGGKRLAEELGVPLLAQIPLVQSICQSGDGGVPVACEEHSVTATFFDALAQKTVEILQRKQKNANE